MIDYYAQQEYQNYWRAHTVCNEVDGSYSYHGIKMLAEAEKLCQEGLWSGIGEIHVQYEHSTTGFIFTGIGSF